MFRVIWVVAAVIVALVLPSAAGGPHSGGGGEEAADGLIEVYSVEAGGMVTVDRVVKSDRQWRQELTPEQYHVMREEGTERAFTGAYASSRGVGVYRCAACGNDLFLSRSKYDSGTGWPSFFQPVHQANVGNRRDRSLWMVRTEVHCSRCGAHLGHVFDDGPQPTGLRYCMNSVSLDFVPMELAR